MKISFHKFYYLVLAKNGTGLSERWTLPETGEIMNTNSVGHYKTMGLRQKLINQVKFLAKNVGGAGLWRSCSYTKYVVKEIFGKNIFMWKKIG